MWGRVTGGSEGHKSWGRRARGSLKTMGTAGLSAGMGKASGRKLRKKRWWFVLERDMGDELSPYVGVGGREKQQGAG